MRGACSEGIAKVEAELHVEPHEIHVYPMFAAVSRRGRDGVRRMVRFMGLR